MRYDLLASLYELLSQHPTLRAEPLNDISRLQVFSAGYYAKVSETRGAAIDHSAACGVRTVEELRGDLNVLLAASPRLGRNDSMLSIEELLEIFSAGHEERRREERALAAIAAAEEKETP